MNKSDRTAPAGNLGTAECVAYRLMLLTQAQVARSRDGCDVRIARRGRPRAYMQSRQTHANLGSPRSSR